MYLICPICGKQKKIKPSQNKILKTCGSKTCRYQQMWNSKKKQINDRIEEPVEKALYRLYVEERKGYRYIASIFGVVERTVARLMKEFGIEPRGRSEAIETQWENNPQRKEVLARATSRRMREYYANGGIPPSQLPGVAEKISRAKKKKNWMKGCTGPKNPNWRGGKKWWRGKDWENRRKEILERDGYICTRCSTTQEKNVDACGMSLSVHHIVPYRLSKDNSPSNLKTLCSVCHTWEDYQFEWLL